MKQEPMFQILDGKPLGKEWVYHTLAINEATMMTFQLYAKAGTPQDERHGLYEHYKGNAYTFLGVAIHEVSGDRYAVYVAEYPPCKTWVRPESDFFGAVEIDCVTRPRFERIP